MNSLTFPSVSGRATSTGYWELFLQSCGLIAHPHYARILLYYNVPLYILRYDLIAICDTSVMPTRLGNIYPVAPKEMTN